MQNDQLPAMTTPSWREILDLRKRMKSAKNPDPKDVNRFRQLALATPTVLALTDSTMQSMREQLVEKITDGTSRASMLAETDVLAKQLGYDTAPPLERLLIDHILTVRVRLIYAENAYTVNVLSPSVTFRNAEYWDNLLSSTQARFLRAIETLARVRRLGRNTPALQINIAHEGGQQVNVQGEVRPGQAGAPAR